MDNFPKKLSEIDTEKKRDRPKKDGQTGQKARPPKEAFPQKEARKSREITKIQAQKKKGRYNIFIDGKYAFPVAEDVLIKFGLYKGMEVSPALEKEINQADDYAKAYARAVNYLSYGLRSAKQVKDDLIEKDFIDQADDVVSQLQDQGYINDMEFAKAYTRTAARINRKGPKTIEQDLIKKGLSRPEIEAGLSEYSDEEKLENALKLTEKQLKKSANRSNRQTQEKIRLHLMQKGFDREIIDQVFFDMETEKDSEAEYEALKKQADKAWRRYSKFDRREQIQKTKANLYQKGYPMDLIQAYLDEKEEDFDWYFRKKWLGCWNYPGLSRNIIRLVRRWKTRPALAKRHGPLPCLGVWDYAAADPGGDRHPLLWALYETLSHHQRPGRVWHGRIIEVLGGPGLLQPGPEYADGCPADYGPAWRGFPWRL